MHFSNIQIKKKKGKKWPTNPPNFQAKKANKPLFYQALSPHKVIIYIR